MIRAGFGASYAPVKAVGGSAHFQGFSQIINFPDQTGGITPVFKLSDGMPYWPAPPFIDPTFGNNNSVDWWQGQESNRLPEMWSGISPFSVSSRGGCWWRPAIARSPARTFNPTC